MEEINFLFIFVKKILQIFFDFLTEEKIIPSKDLVVILYAKHFYTRSQPNYVNGFSPETEKIWIQRKVNCKKTVKKILLPFSVVVSQKSYLQNFKEIEVYKIHNLFHKENSKSISYEINDITYNLQIEKAGQL